MRETLVFSIFKISSTPLSISPSFQENCLHRIYALLDHQNIYQCILDSYRFNIATLKQRVAHFVGQNLQRVTGRKEWNEVGERTQLEVLKEAIRRMDVGDLEQRVERSKGFEGLGFYVKRKENSNFKKQKS